jgi:FkbM family methyltransferase
MVDCRIMAGGVKRAAKALALGVTTRIGSARLQPVLDRAVTLLQYLQGIGSGGDLASSGELAVLARLRPYVAGKPFFDVGANCGEYSELILELYGPATVIHAFEPSAAAFAALRQRLAGNGSVVKNHCALSDASATIALFSDRPGSALASVYRRKLDHFEMSTAIEEEVGATRLDDYCAGKNIVEIGLLKLDVEGHELAVLRGAGELLEARRIFAIQFEFGGCNIDSRTFFQDFWYFLTGHGFHLYRILPNGCLLALPRYKELYEQFRTTNFLATLQPVI